MNNTFTTLLKKIFIDEDAVDLYLTGLQIIKIENVHSHIYMPALVIINTILAITISKIELNFLPIIILNTISLILTGLLLYFVSMIWVKSSSIAKLTIPFDLLEFPDNIDKTSISVDILLNANISYDVKELITKSNLYKIHSVIHYCEWASRFVFLAGITTATLFFGTIVLSVIKFVM